MGIIKMIIISIVNSVNFVSLHLLIVFFLV